ncbi:hypothetical protein [Paenibacillus tengchongensis]|uniref:hypothetical protein n=1 Tax=Paenibacillus tengchongensis TaxID=2608684 RepID=UPI00124DB1D7|nr:hypothetical protein [Paenibacillus tengchongensis]
MTRNRKETVALTVGILISWMIYVSLFDLFKLQEAVIFNDNSASYSFIMLVSYLMSMLFLFKIISRGRLVMMFSGILVLTFLITNAAGEVNLSILVYMLSVTAGIILGGVCLAIRKTLISILK